MTVNHNKARAYALVLLIFALFSAADAQKKSKSKKRSAPPVRVEALANPVMWEPVDARDLDLYVGPGGTAMEPDLSSVTFIKEEKQGHNKKYRIKDAKGQEWVAKLGREAQPETAAVRLLYGLGYKTEINYLAPTITIPGKGTFRNVRLEARPSDVERLDEWKWKSNPFVGTNELQGLKIMMVFLTNWDLLDLQNKVLRVNNNGRVEHQYIVSDLGATYGKLGNNNLPIFFRLGRKTNNPRVWSKARFIKGVEGNRIVFAFKGKNRGLMKDVTVDQGRWLLGRLNQLSERQLQDIYRAANYSPADVDILTKASQRRIRELAEAVGSRNLALR
jgi:hypothetical protein